MRKAGTIVTLLLCGCVTHGGIRPLRPLEIATSLYNPVTTERLTGSLMYEGGCLLFRDERTGGLLLPVWPAGSSFNGTAVLFHEPAKADQRVILTEEFVMSGERVQWPTLSASAYQPFYQQCNAQPFTVSHVRSAN